MQSDGWRQSLLWREAVRNVFSARARLLPLVFFAVVLGAGQVVFMASENNDLADHLSSLYLTGRNVLVFTPAVQGARTTISRQSCERLVDTRGIVAAGLFVVESPSDFAQLGGSIPVVAASTTLFPELKNYDAIVGRRLRHSPGSFVLGLGKGAEVRAVTGERSPEGIDTNSAVVVPLSAGIRRGSECIVVLGKFGSVKEAVPEIGAELNVTGGAISGQAQLQESTDLVRQFVGRPGRLFAPVLGFLAGLAAALLNRFRSSEFAAYRMSGTSRRSLAVLIVQEQWLVAGVAFTASIASTIGLQAYFFDPLVPALWSLAGAAIWVFVGATGSVGIILRSPMKLAKDR